MGYHRTIPRDLFNEGNLLKCLGSLYCELEKAGHHQARLIFKNPDGFNIDQNPADGSISATNIHLLIAGKPYLLFRPLNSRQPWPLYTQLDHYDDPREVFKTDGTLSDAFLELIGSDKKD